MDQETLVNKDCSKQLMNSLILNVNAVIGFSWLVQEQLFDCGFDIMY